MTIHNKVLTKLGPEAYEELEEWGKMRERDGRSSAVVAVWLLIAIVVSVGVFLGAV